MNTEKREMKFRAWHKLGMRFIYSDWKYGVVSFWDNICNDWAHEHEPPQEYTGLKDKNDTDSYEYDIVKTDIGIGKVIFHCGCFMIEWIDDPESNMELLGISNFKRGTPREFEIIGNIYSKPESKQL